MSGCWMAVLLDMYTLLRMRVPHRHPGKFERYGGDHGTPIVVWDMAKGHTCENEGDLVCDNEPLLRAELQNGGCRKQHDESQLCQPH